MRFASLKSWAGRHWHSIPGWRTDRKIVVFESDDWGSIRMPSNEVFKFFNNKGYPVAMKPSESFDALESEKDMLYLLNLLINFKDQNGRCPVFTMNYNLTNPDFKRIEMSDFREYFFEPFTATLQAYENSSGVFNLLTQGIDKGVFFPQYHGITHFNFHHWLRLLQSGNEDALLAFKHKMVGITPIKNPEEGNQLMVALKFEDSTQFEEQLSGLKTGCKLFKGTFGYISKSFIAPSYTWNRRVEEVLWNEGIEYIQGGIYQIEPSFPDGAITRIKHSLGSSNKYSQVYLTRNIYFDPSTDSEQDWLNDAIARIQTLFFWNKPAIISTHRLNYIGRICPDNRDRNLLLLEKLISKILALWPEIEFMTSVELGQLIKDRKDDHHHSYNQLRS